MPYKDASKRKEVQRRSMAKARGCEPLSKDVNPQSCEPRLHTKEDVNPWPKYDSEGRINPATMEPYKAPMMEILGYAPWAITEYERKRVREDVLVIHDLPREQVDSMYRSLVASYGKRGEM